MNNLRVLIFTKNRPLQLRAYLESFLRATKCDLSLVSVLAPDYRDYSRVRAQFPAINWLLEADSFNQSFRGYLSRLEPDHFVLLEVDDQIWLREADLQKACDICGKVECFSLRLGRNIPGKRYDEKHYESYMTWNWRGSEGHWGYPFATGGTIYPVRLIDKLLHFSPDWTNAIYRQPNDWETIGVRWMRENSNGIFACNLEGIRPALAAVVSQDINRVRRKRSFGQEHQSASSLLVAEREGYRRKWETIWNKEYQDCFIDGQDWELEKL